MSDSTSSSSTLTSPHVAGMFGLKTILETTVKLNGSNYLLWTQAFRIFIGAQNKLAHLLEPSPAVADTTPTKSDFLVTSVLNIGYRRYTDWLNYIPDTG